MVTLDKIYHASYVLKDVVIPTPLVKATAISDDCEVYLKPENLQITGSFKVRGSGYKISQLTEEEKKRGVIACSAGNHAQGVALAATKYGIKSLICLPDGAPISKVEATKGYGAEVCMVPGVYDDAYNKACELRDEHNYTFIHPFDDENVIAGQGTIGIEILEDLPTVDIVVVPAGGGGLLAGIAACIKQINPRVKIIGVQSEGAPAIAQSFAKKKHISTDSAATIADGIAVKAPGRKTVDIINKYADDVVTVTDNEISAAILLLLERTKQVVEPAGATPLAAVLNGKIDVNGKKVACVLSGGNIDVSFIQRIIDLGLASRDRKLKFCTTLLDIPGSLAHLSNVLSGAGANIIMVQYDRFSAELDPNEAIIHMACEVSGTDHGKRVVKKLEENGYKVIKE